MSTIQEIEAAIERLPAADRDAFEARLIARRCGIDALDSGEYRELLASLDEAEREIDSGRASVQMISDKESRGVLESSLVVTK
ncbi:MAG: hypothetical protein H0W20_05735 [Chthoniobacterales bacterium]|nr:hypothetical protein [Chthoniobacterales bacterium]